MLVMMYLPTDGRNISGADLSAPDVSLYTTLVAFFAARVFSLALFFFLMSAVEQRVPRWLHLTISRHSHGFLAFGHLGSEGSPFKG